MKKLLLLFSFLTVPSYILAIDSVRIAANGETADAVTIADQKIEVSSLSVVQIISSGTIISNSSASITTNNQMAVTVSTNFIVLNPGFLGIGTNAMPSSKLDIVGGSVTIRGTNAGITLKDSGVILIGTDPEPVSSRLSIDYGALTGYLRLNRSATNVDNMINWRTNKIDYWYLGFRDIAPLNGFRLYSIDEAGDVLVFDGSGRSGVGVNIIPSSRFDVLGGSITVRGTNAGFSVGEGTFTVQTDGDVGINTLSPTSRFDMVGGSVTIRGANSGFSVGEGTFTVQNDGDIGINTLNPTSRFDMVGGSMTIRGAGAGLRVNGGAAVTSEIGAGASGITSPQTSLLLTGRPNSLAVPTLAFDTGTEGQGFAIENVAGKLDIYSGGSSWVREIQITANETSITDNLTVGQGASAASSRFDVVGGSVTIRGTNAGLAITGAAGAGNNFNLLQISTGATNLFTVSGTSIVAAVDIYKNATAYANPDYVFEKDYKLMSIDELRQFIKKNKHLPNMQSTAEINKKGSVNLSEQNRVLIEKVEELYLYVFEQEERLSRLESLIGVAYTHK